MDTAPAVILAELAAHPARGALIGAVRDAALGAAAERRATFLREAATPPETLLREQAETRFGNVCEVIERGNPSADQAALVSVLLALGVESDFPSAPETELARAKDLVFLSAYSPANALAVADAVLGEERARALWRAVAWLSEAKNAATPAEAFTALALLAASPSEAARAAATELATRSSDPTVRALCVRESAPPTTRLSGELGPTPHGPIATALLALSGILFVLRASRLIGRLGLAFRQPAEVRLTERGLEIAHRTELLGRVVRARETLVPLANLARVTREVRYPRLGLYLGLLALALGSYIGVGLFVDGARVPGGSAPLLGMGLLIVALGLAIDYGLSTLADTVRGQCRLVVVPKKGKSVCVGALDPNRADAMLAAVASQVAPS